MLNWRNRAAADRQVPHDHIIRYGEHSVRRLFTRVFVPNGQNLSCLQHLDPGYTLWGSREWIRPDRVAPRATAEGACANGDGQKARASPRGVRTVRRDGRELLGHGAAIRALVTGRVRSR